jgi:hypothetical protein
LPPGHLHHLVRGTRGQDLRPRPHPQARMRAGRMRMGTCTSLSTAGENGPPCDGVADSRQTLRPARPRAVDTFLAAHPSGHLMTTGPDGVPDAALLAYFSAVATCRMKTGMELGGASLPTARRRTSTGGASPTKGLGNSSSDGPMPTSRRAGSPRAGARPGRPELDYSTVHLPGSARVHDDREWLRASDTMLTDLHESGRDHRWFVTDAPETYVNGQLRRGRRRRARRRAGRGQGGT